MMLGRYKSMRVVWALAYVDAQGQETTEASAESLPATRKVPFGLVLVEVFLTSQGAVNPNVISVLHRRNFEFDVVENPTWEKVASMLQQRGFCLPWFVGADVVFVTREERRAKHREQYGCPLDFWETCCGLGNFTAAMEKMGAVVMLGIDNHSGKNLHWKKPDPADVIPHTQKGWTVLDWDLTDRDVIRKI